KTPLQGAEVLASGVPNAVKTDSLGRFTIEGLAPGTYQVAVYHPLLESLDIRLVTQPFSVGRDSAGVVRLAVPSIPTLVRRYCAGALSSQTPSVIAGRVIDPDNEQPVSNAKVSVSWQEIFISKTTGVVRSLHEVHAETNPSGFFKLCGLPSDVSGTLQVNRVGVLSPEIPVSIDGALLDFQTVYVPEKIEERGEGVVTGRVLSPKGKPIAGARVEIPMSNAATATSDDGSFRFAGLRSGTQMLIIRGGSYPTVAQPVDVSPREPVVVMIRFSEPTK
ncbi:MAG TPA: carboxypeptidase regulatory-like domain-containing protein, partial [Gemmatimonadaceae bacterium]|nr:carboxypeptidase regulatory-like domain-containing protein [Gemmatimonadaceae bacterium]